jgi:hypothetical protein
MPDRGNLSFGKYRDLTIHGGNAPFLLRPEQNEQHYTHRCLSSWFSLGFEQTVPSYAAGAKTPGLVI